MFSTQKVTSSTSKDLGTASSSTSNRPPSQNTSNNPHSGKTVKTKPLVNTANMEIEFQKTGETGIETMEFNFSSPPSPFRFGGEESEEKILTENTHNFPTQRKKD